MAYRVQVRRESIGRTSLISLFREQKVFEESRIRTIQEKWQEFEYKLAGPSRNLQIFIDYIKYQICMIKMVQIMKQLTKFMRNKIVNMLIADVKQLFETCSQTPSYSSDFDVFVLQLSFYRITGDLYTGNMTVERLMKHHPSKPETWKAACNWFIDINKPEMAINTLQQALKAFGDPVNTEIYENLLKIEINTALGKYGSKTKRQDESVSDERISILEKKLDIYTTDILKRDWPTNEFLFAALKLVEQYTFTKSMQNRLCAGLTMKFGHLARTWGQLAERALGGSNPRDAIKIYDDGLNALSENKTECQWLWCEYLDFLLSITIQPKIIPREDAKALIFVAFKKASDSHMLLEKYYVDWFDMSEDCDCVSVLERGTENIPDALELWKLRLHCEMLRDRNILGNPTLENVFSKGIECCKENALPLWSSMIRYKLLKGNSDEVERLYAQCTNSALTPENISDIMKPRYVEWVSSVRTIESAVSKYFDLTNNEPYCKQIHITTARMLSCCNMKNTVIETVFLRGLNQFPKDPDMYNHLLSYYQYREAMPIMERKKKQVGIYEKAKVNLDLSAFAEVDEKYNELKKLDMNFFGSTDNADSINFSL